MTLADNDHLDWDSTTKPRAREAVGPADMERYATDDDAVETVPYEPDDPGHNTG